MRVMLVTSAAARRLDTDLPLLGEALSAAGAKCEVVVWDDPAVDWAGADAVVVRSTWDYVPRRAAFLEWAERVAAAAPLHNPPAVLAWNTDKRYLADLAAAGVPTVPTTFVAPGESAALPEAEVVVKPAVSAGSLDTARYSADRRAEAAAHARRLLAEGRTVMVQPYVDGVDEEGETALVFFGGRFSHSIRKGPILLPEMRLVDGLYAEEDISPRRAEPDELEVARAALAAVPWPEPLLYARVDVVRMNGAPAVLELELTEPSLFVDQDPGAPERFAAALRAQAG